MVVRRSGCRKRLTVKVRQVPETFKRQILMRPVPPYQTQNRQASLTEEAWRTKQDQWVQKGSRQRQDSLTLFLSDKVSIWEADLGRAKAHEGSLETNAFSGRTLNLGYVQGYWLELVSGLGSWCVGYAGKNVYCYETHLWCRRNYIQKASHWDLELFISGLLCPELEELQISRLASPQWL
jgi:hypothetical protein